MGKVRKPPMRWETQHENLLFMLWQQNIIALNNKKRTCEMYQIMAEKLVKAGLQLKWKDVRTKVDNLIRKYRIELKDMEALGRPSVWRHFEKIHTIVGDIECEKINNEMLQTADDTMLIKEESLHCDDSYSVASKSFFVDEATTDDHFNSSITFPVAAESPPSSKRTKSVDTNQMTPFEEAMLEIERDRTERLEHIAMCRLNVMKRMAAENAEFHRKILDLMNSNV